MLSCHRRGHERGTKRVVSIPPGTRATVLGLDGAVGGVEPLVDAGSSAAGDENRGALPRELRFQHAPRRFLRRPHLNGGGAAGGAGLWRRVGHGGGRGPVRCDRGRLFRVGVRRHAVSSIRTDGAHDRSHGGHHRPLRGQPHRSPAGGRPGRFASGASGTVQGRPLRGLHALCGGVRAHVRYRYHHHADPGFAVPGIAPRGGRDPGSDCRTAGGGKQYQRQRLRHRHRHPRRWSALASPHGEIPSRTADGAGCWACCG